MSFFKNIGRSLGLSYGDRNPADAAMPYLNQIPGTVNPLLNPYIGEGRQADANARNALNRSESLYASAPDLYANALPQYGQMANNPVEFLNMLQRSYTPSEGYNYRKNQLEASMRNTANAGGYAGNTFDQNSRAEALSGILGQDQQQNLENLLGILSGGLGGQERLLSGRERHQERTLGGRERALTNMAQFEQGIGNRGFNAASELANMLAGNLGNQAQFSLYGQRYQNAGKQGARKNRLGFLGQALGFINPLNMMG